MSGHSKWAQIKRQKGVTDQKRGALFAKMGKVITLATKTGGLDPASNFSLRLAVDKAKAANMPKDNIERAIQRGAGELSGGELYELTYEGYGPGGVAVVIKALTDNKNRTASELKHLLSELGGVLSQPGAVMWQFQECGLIRFAKAGVKASIDLENLSLKAIDLGAVDVSEADDAVAVKTDRQDLQRVQEELEKAGFRPEQAGLELVAVNLVVVNESQARSLAALFEALDDRDDVSEYYTNVSPELLNI